MNVKKVVFPLLLLTSFSFISLHGRDKVHLNDPLLQLVDGMPGAMDAASFKKCFDSWGIINSVQYKDQYALLGKQTTFKDIVMKEYAFTKKGIAKDDAQYKALLATLAIIKKQFKTKMAALLTQAESETTKETNKKLVNLWLKNHNKKDSILSSWGESNQDEILDKANAQKFFVFLNDLKHFLEDLMYSCKKARKSFKEQCLKESDYNAFEKFFTN